MLDRHPVAVLISVILTLVTMATGIASGWYFIKDERERSIKQSMQLDGIRSTQEAIRIELATQTLALTAIRNEQNEIAGRQRWLASEVNRSVGVMAIDVGRLIERTK